MIEQAKGTSVALVEKFPTDESYALARQIVADAYKHDPWAFKDDGRVWQMPKRLGIFPDRRPGYAVGSWDGIDVVRSQLEFAFAVEEQRESGAMILRPRYKRNGRVLAHKLWGWADNFREFVIARAISEADELALCPGNLWLNEGINEAFLLICGGGGTAYNNANAQLGVGDSATAAAATQTDLQAAANKLFKAMDSGFPTSGTLQKATFKCSFATGEANYAWNEWSVRNGSAEAAAENLNRKQEGLGTKATGTWTLTVDCSIA